MSQSFVFNESNNDSLIQLSACWWCCLFIKELSCGFSRL